MKKDGLKNDRYRKVRGGYSRLLEISCECCGKFVAWYQKDGPGPLKRMYLDRFIDRKPGHSAKLECGHCGRVLGILYVYEKEKRPAFRLFVGAVVKRIVKAR